MIHTTMHGPPKRRIAVIAIPRPQKARLGSIGNGNPAAPAIAWTTIDDAPADSSAAWLAMQIKKQNWHRNNTQGTLTYTPASVTPAPNVPAYNSWVSPNCLPAPAAAASDIIDSHPNLWMAIGILGAAASAMYLLNSISGRGK